MGYGGEVLGIEAVPLIDSHRSNIEYQKILQTNIFGMGKGQEGGQRRELTDKK